MKNKLSILLQRTNEKDSLQNAADNGRLLAMTPSAIDQCEELGVEFLSPDDFISFKEYRDDVFAIYTETSSLCQRLDASVNPKIVDMRPYRSDTYSFWVLHANMLYVHHLAERLQDEFEDFSFIGVPELRPLAEAITPDLSEWYVVNCFGEGLPFVAMLLDHLLPVSDYVREPAKISEPLLKAWQRFRPALRYVKNKLIGLRKRCQSVTTASVNILTSGVGYGIECLKEAVPEAHFILFDDVLPQMPPPGPPQLEPESLEREILSFSEKWLPRLSDILLAFFRNHHRSNISTLPRLQELVGAVFDKTGPVAVFFTNGILGQVWFSIAREANKRGIPVVVTQHGGLQLHKSPPGFCNETPDTIESIWVYQGALDEERFPGARRFRGGNIPAWRIAARPLELPNDALYLHGGNSFSFYGAMACSDLTRHRSIIEVIRVFGNHKAPLTFKTHVVDSDYNKRYFKGLISRLGQGTEKVLFGGYAEAILHRYGLIVIENVNSLTSILALGLDRPVILHTPNDCLIRDDIRSALMDRVYYSTNEKELAGFVERFKAGDLPVKGLKRARENFMWPTEGPDPVLRTAGFLRSLIEGDVDFDNKD